MTKDLYKLLGVKRTATPDELRKAYRKKAASLHPDRNPGDAKAEAKYKEVTFAYEVLNDPLRRAHYDRTGETGKAFDDRAQRLIPLLNSLLMSAIKGVAEEGKKVEKVNLVERMRKAIREMLKALEDSRKILERTVDRYTNQDGGENVLKAIVEQTLRMNVEEVKMYEEALDFLKTYGYKTDREYGPEGYVTLALTWDPLR